MGDLVEITTVPKQQKIFYKVTSGSLRFQVKGPRNAAIGLTRLYGDTKMLWFVLGTNGMSMVQNNDRTLQTVITPNILSAQEFREFWIQWHNGTISLGRGYTEHPLLIYEDKTTHLTYFTFSVHHNDICTLQWRFEMPPLQDITRIKPVSNGIPKWVPAEEQLPDGILIGGFEKEILYIIRAKHMQSLTPGKFVPSHGVGYIPWGGVMHLKNELEVLCGYDCMWLPCSNGEVPVGSVVAGYSEVENETLYVGRVLYDNHLIPGKVQPTHQVCYIPYEGREIARRHYEVLVVPHKNVRCANRQRFHRYRTIKMT